MLETPQTRSGSRSLQVLQPTPMFNVIEIHPPTLHHTSTLLPQGRADVANSVTPARLDTINLFGLFTPLYSLSPAPTLLLNTIWSRRPLKVARLDISSAVARIPCLVRGSR